MAIIKSKKSLKGVIVSHFKNSQGKETVTIPTPKTVTIPMSQHMGAVCSPLVKKGDTVFLGQKIGESDQNFSVPIHSSCSGTVTEVREHISPMGTICQAIVIETDGLQTLDPNITTPSANNLSEFIESIKQSGLVGLGGAGFPTHIKLGYKDIDKVTKLVINAAECEPFITSDYRECMENTQNVVDGIKLVQKFLNIDEVYIGIEDNKPDAIKKLNEAFGSDETVNVVRLKTIYPQGAEKSIIYATTSVVVVEGKLPADCGVIVMNVSSVGFIGGYFKDGIPLTTRRITVDGDAVTNPQNLRVPIGISIRDVLAYCEIDDGYEEFDTETKDNFKDPAKGYGKILMGGPMMGIPVIYKDYPVIKNNNAITVLSIQASAPAETTACIRCSKCVYSCPMGLMPLKLEAGYDNRDVDSLKTFSATLCINCGCCSFICPAKRHLAQKIQLGKELIRNNK